MEGILKNRLFHLMREYEFRTGSELTQKALAERVGVSESVIRRWVKNEIRRFDADIVEGFCKVLDCDVSDLLYLEQVSTN
jgi:DNA-binding Xre family transcriptional regulator